MMSGLTEFVPFKIARPVAARTVPSRPGPSRHRPGRDGGSHNVTVKVTQKPLVARHRDR